MAAVNDYSTWTNNHYHGRIQDFKLGWGGVGGGGALKKLRRAEGGAKIVGVFRVYRDTVF